MRRDELRQNRGGTYIETINPLGYDILINGSNKYLNFNAISGSSGYGIRDNSGSMEFKNSGGSRTAFSSIAGISISGTPVDNQVAIWTGATSIEGNTNLQFDGTKLSVGGVDTMTVNGSLITTHIAVHGSDGLTEAEVEMHRHGDTAAAGVAIYGARSRGSAGAPTIVQSGDALLNYTAVGYDGTDYATAAQIQFEVDGTPGSNDMPGRIVFNTSSDGGQTLTERMRISSAGVVSISTTTGNTLVVDTSTLVVDATNNRIGILTTAPTHSITLASTSTGIALYNTADQTTNFERALMSWSSNIFTIAVTRGGTGSTRRLALTATAGTFRITESSITATTGGVYVFAPVNIGAGASTGIGYAQTASNSSGNVDILSLTPTWSQTGTASYTVLFINSTETTTGSGAKNLILAQVGGVTKFGVSSIGDVTTTGIVSATGSITSTITGASSTVPVTITVDSSVATQTALLVKNATNYAHTGNLITGKLLNATDSGAVLKLENAGSGNYITADSVFSVEKSGLINSSIGLRYVSSPGTDDTYNGISVSLTAAAITAQWEIGYMNSSGKVALADASAISTSSALFIATAAISADAAGVYLLHGIIRNDAWNWTVGGLLYLSETAGAITQTAPSATDSVTQIVGIALSADTIYRKPEILGQVEHT